MLKEAQASVAVILSTEQPRQILLTRRHQPKSSLHGKWHLPGGQIENDETPKQAIIRELQEELSICVTETLEEKTIELNSTTHTSTVFCFYLIELSISTPVSIQGDPESSQFSWVPLEEVASLDVFDSVLLALHHFKLL